MSDLSAIQGWLSNVQSTMSGLPSQFQQAAQSGDFASVFSEAQSILATPPGTAGAAAPSTTAGPSTTSLLSGAGTASSTTGTTVVTTAEKYLGVPYLWGGTTPSGFDCSGFTQYVYAQLGISLPRTSEEQALAGVAVPSLADAQPGDLVFFAGSDGTTASPGHVGIYLGGGEMIDAPDTGSTVSIQPVGQPVAIRRILTGTTAPASSSASAPAGATTVLTNSGLPTSAASLAGGSAAVSAVLSPTASVTVPSTLAPLFQSAAQQYGVPATLLAAVAQVESGYDPTAVSSAGAQGLMQIMPTTAAGLGVDPLDPAQAIAGAAQLLSGYLAAYHSVPEALAAYNAGGAAVAQYGGVPPFAQTQAYVEAVMQVAGVSS